MAEDHEVQLRPRGGTAAPADDVAALRRALRDAGSDPTALRAIVRTSPAAPEAWAALSDAASDPLDAYAYARVGYHRGLDALRAAGWRGSGYVRWRHESNRGFLRSLHNLELAAAAIGEVDEEQRCALFLRQLDPEWGTRQG